MKFLSLRPPRADERAIALLLVFVAFALRVFHLGAQAIWWDESLSLYRATRDLSTILANTILIQNVVTTDLQPPLYFLMLHFLIGAFGASEFALRFLSLAANVATVALLYVLGRRMFSPEVGLLATFLGALSPFYVWFAQEARPYALVLFWSTLGVYALTRAFTLHVVARSREAATKQFLNALDRLLRSARNDIEIWIFVYVFSTIAALYTNYYAVFLLPFHALFILLLVWRDQRARKFLLLPALPALSAIFLLPIIARGAAGNVNSGPSFVPLDIILRDLVNSFSVGITMDAAQAVWIDAAMLVVFLIGVVFAESRNTNHREASPWDATRLTLLAFLFLPTLIIYAASFIRPLYQNSRYLIAWSPAWYLGVALGTVALSRFSRYFASFAILVFLVAAAISLNNLYFNPQYGKDDHRAWAESLRERARAGDFLILDSPHTEELFNYYARGVVPYTTLPILSATGVVAYAEDTATVRDALRNSTRVWFLSMHAPFDDPHARIEKLLNENGVLLDRENFLGTSTEIALSQYMKTLPIATASEIMVSLNYAVDSHLRLVGIEPKTNPQGTRVLVKLYWQLDEPVGEDYGVSLRLLDGGARIAQWDSIILGNRAGTSTWPIKKIIVDEHDIPIAAGTLRSTYHLAVQVYHLATGNGIGNTIVMFDAIWLR